MDLSSAGDSINLVNLASGKALKASLVGANKVYGPPFLKKVKKKNKKLIQRPDDMPC
jgi:hypothetical protein